MTSGRNKEGQPSARDIKKLFSFKLGEPEFSEKFVCVYVS